MGKKLNPTVTTLLGELREECLSTIKLIYQLENEQLTEEHIEDVSGDLTASTTHLQIHAAIVKEELDKT